MIILDKKPDRSGARRAGGSKKSVKKGCVNVEKWGKIL